MEDNKIIKLDRTSTIRTNLSRFALIVAPLKVLNARTKFNIKFQPITEEEIDVLTGVLNEPAEIIDKTLDWAQSMAVSRVENMAKDGKFTGEDLGYITYVFKTFNHIHADVAANLN